MSRKSGATVTVDTAPRDRRIEVPWTQINTELCDKICKALVDRDTDMPVKVLDLLDNQLGPQKASKVASCLESAGVKNVSIRFNNIGKDGCDGIAGVVSVSASLTHVDIRGNGLTASDARKLLKSMATSTTVKHLALGNNKLGPEGATLVYRALEKNTYLTYLDLSLNEIGPSGAGALAELLATPASTLQTVLLYGNYLGVAGVGAICAAMRHNREVKRLSLGNNHATDDAAGAIAEMLAENSVLEDLDLRLNSLTAGGCRTIARQGLEKNTGLLSLSLSGNAIESVGADDIARSLITFQRSNLQSLDLSSCSLNSSGAMRIANMIGMSMTIHTLNLSDNNLDDEAALSLAQNIAKSESITNLDLSCNMIGEVGASNLIDAAQINMRLCALVLQGNLINRVVQKKLDNLLEERLAKNRVQSRAVDLAVEQQLASM